MPWCVAGLKGGEEGEGEERQRAGLAACAALCRARAPGRPLAESSQQLYFILNHKPVNSGH